MPMALDALERDFLWRVISKNEPYSGLESFRNGFCDHKIYDEDHQFGNNIKLTGLQVP